MRIILATGEESQVNQITDLTENGVMDMAFLDAESRAGFLADHPIAEEVADRIAAGEANDRLTWLGDGRVRVKMGRIFPQGHRAHGLPA